MTVFSDSFTSHNEKILDHVHGLIRDAMNDGEYNNVHPDIIEIFYWNRKTFANKVVDSPPEHIDRSTLLPVYFWCFIGIGVTGFLLFFGVLSWRQRQKENEERNSVESIGIDSGDSNSTVSSHQSDPHTGITLLMQAANTVSAKSDSHLGIILLIQAEGSLPARSGSQLVGMTRGESTLSYQPDSQLLGVRPADSTEFDYLPRSLSRGLASREI
jgi:hypothetical protein